MSPFGEAGSGSLLNDVVDWMLAPLAVLWPVAIAVSYAIGTSIADGPFDRELSDRVVAIADEVVRLPAATEPLSPPTLNRIRTDPVERGYAQVAGPDGKTVAGDALPAPGPGECAERGVRFRNAMTEHGGARIACLRVRQPGTDTRLALQVAETLERRAEHATQVTLMVMGVVLLLVPLTLGLVGFGLYYGLRPIRKLRHSIEARGPTDLSPLPTEGAPTELAPLLGTLNAQLERVRANLEAQRRFVADAAHQLRTPLAALKTQAQLGSQSRSLDEAGMRLGRIAESADHLSRLASQLLALARADETRAVPASPVDLGAALRTACHQLADAAIARSIRLSLDVPDAGPVIAGDSGLLHELFVNLMDNAIRYTPEGGEVAVRVRGAAPAMVEVEDTGPGIPEAEGELVFERFYRVLGTGIPGSGLGLPIVKAIAERHGAAVALAPGDGGRGTRVTVTFLPREGAGATPG